MPILSKYFDYKKCISSFTQPSLSKLASMIREFSGVLFSKNFEFKNKFFNYTIDHPFLIQFLKMIAFLPPKVSD